MEHSNIPFIVQSQINNTIKEQNVQDVSLNTQNENVKDIAFSNSGDNKIKIRPEAPKVSYKIIMIDNSKVGIQLSAIPSLHDEIGSVRQIIDDTYSIIRDGKIIKEGLKPTLDFTDTDVKYGQIYNYVVRVISPDGSFNNSSQISISTIDSTIPHNPYDFTFLFDSPGSSKNGVAKIVFTQNNDEDYNGMSILCKESHLAETEWKQIKYVPLTGNLGTEISAVLPGLIEGKYYDIAIQAMDNFGNISEKTLKYSIFVKDNVAPNPVSIVVSEVIDEITSQKTRTTWKRPEPKDGIDDISGYIIQRAEITDGIQSYSTLSTITSADTLLYDDSTAVSGKTYTYRVCAYDEQNNNSDYSYSNKVTIQAILNSATISVVSLGSPEKTFPFRVTVSNLTEQLVDGLVAVIVKKSTQNVICGKVPVTAVVDSTTRRCEIEYNMVYFDAAELIFPTETFEENAYQVKVYKRVLDNNVLTNFVLLATQDFTIDMRPPAVTGLSVSFDPKNKKFYLKWDKVSFSILRGYEIRYSGTGIQKTWDLSTKIQEIFSDSISDVVIDAPADIDLTVYKQTSYFSIKAKSSISNPPIWMSSASASFSNTYVYGKLPVPINITASGEKRKINIKCDPLATEGFKEFVLYASYTQSDLTSPTEAMIAYRGASNIIPIDKMPDNSLLPLESTTVYFKLVASNFQGEFGISSSVFSSTTIDSVSPTVSIENTTPDVRNGVVKTTTFRGYWTVGDNSGNLNEAWGRIIPLGGNPSAWQKQSISGASASGYFDFTGLSTGTYTYEVKAVDSSLNDGGATISFEIDNAQAADVNSISVSQVDASSLIISISATLPAHFKCFDLYYQKQGNSTWYFASRVTSMSGIIPIPSDGTSRFKAVVKKTHSDDLDSPGLVYSDYIFLDKIPPTIKITSSPNIFEKFTLLPSNTITFSFECYDEGGMNAATGLMFFVDGVENQITLSTTDNKTYIGSLVIENLANGVHSIYAKAMDLRSNIRESQNYTFEVDLELPANIANSYIDISQNGRNIVLKNTYSTAIKNFKGFEFYLSYDDGTTKTLITPSGINPITYSFAEDKTKVCFSTRAIKLNGVAGDLASLSWTSNIKIDTTPPVISAFSISGISNGYINKAAKNSGINLTYAATDSNSGLAGVYYTKNNGVNWTALSTSPTAITSELSTDGVYSYQLKAIDNSGNIAYSDVITFTVDTVAPSIVTGMSGVIRLNNEINFNASSASDIEGYEIKYGGTNYGDATLLTKIVNNQTSGIITHKWLATSGTTLRVRVKAIDKAGNYSDESYVDIATTIPAAPTGLNGTGTFNGVNFWWNNVTTDNNSIYTDDITGYQYDAYIDSVTVDNKIASAIFTKTNNATVMIPDAKKDGKTHNIIIVLNTINKWSSASSSINLSKAIIRIEAVDMGSNPMQYDVISMKGGNTPLKNTPDLLKLIDGTDDTFITDPTKCKLLLDDLVDLTSGQVPIGYATATKTADGRFTSGTDLSVTVRGSHYGDKFGKSIAVEESRTNLWLNNATASGETAAGTSVLLNEFVEGGQVREVTVSTGGTFSMVCTYYTLQAGVTYVLSAFVKNSLESSSVKTCFQRTSDWAFYSCGGDGESYSKNWRRINFAFTAPTTAQYRASIISYSPANSTFKFALPQLEVGSFATSAIKTEGTAVTRPVGKVKYSNTLVPSVGSISFWGKMNKRGDSTYQHFFDINSTNNGMSVCLELASNRFVAALGAYTLKELDSYNENWNNYIVTFNYLTNIFNAYYNGVFKGSVTGTSLTPQTWANLLFGCGYYNFGGNDENCYKTNVNISNFIVHNTELSQADVLQIYNAGLDGDKVILK